METVYTIRDLQNTHTLDFLNRVMSIVNSVSKEDLLVEKVGYGLNQLDWTDETWNFMTFRCHPIWVSRRPDRKAELVEKLLAALRPAFGDLETEYVGDGPEDKVIVRWGRSRRSIGD